MFIDTKASNGNLLPRVAFNQPSKVTFVSKDHRKDNCGRGHIA